MQYVDHPSCSVAIEACQSDDHLVGSMMLPAQPSFRQRVSRPPELIPFLIRSVKGRTVQMVAARISGTGQSHPRQGSALPSLGGLSTPKASRRALDAKNNVASGRLGACDYHHLELWLFSRCRFLILPWPPRLPDNRAFKCLDLTVSCWVQLVIP